ncbi:MULTISPECIES: hypothetical protein [Commensalibacter]|nr:MULTISPECIES: hypothetical protein [Commensalibacter]
MGEDSKPFTVNLPTSFTGRLKYVLKQVSSNKSSVIAANDCQQ